MTTTLDPSAGTTAIRPFTVRDPRGRPRRAAQARRRRAPAHQGARRRPLAGRAAGDDRRRSPATGRPSTTGAGCEARLNALPQFMTEIDGVDIHFIHVRSPHANALPLIMTHGWPGSVIELLDTVGPLTDPTAHGGRAEDAFDLVLPSIPGYGFSGEPTEIGWDPVRVAQAWAELMRRLGYTRYVAQGGDVGALVTDAMGRAGTRRADRHPRQPARRGAVPRRPSAGGSDEERAALDALTTFTHDRQRLLHRADHAAADDRLLPAGLARRPGGLDARPRHGQLREDLPRLPRRAARRAISPRRASSTTSRCTG